MSKVSRRNGRVRLARSYEVNERLRTRWIRRAVSITAVVALLSLAPLLATLTIPMLLTLDVWQHRRFGLTRCAIAVVYYAICEAAGILASVTLWLLRPAIGQQRFLEWNFRLQLRWARGLFNGLCVVFDLRLIVEGEVPDTAGPVLVFIRHTSLADTVLPAAWLQPLTGWRLRYVMKRELLVSPCLDIVGQRLPNVFLRRGGRESKLEVEAIRALATDLSSDEGILIYPEGSRFSFEKQRRAFERIEENGDFDRLERVRGFRHVLPPRSAGPLAVLEAAPYADVIFFAHIGLDGIRGPSDAASGSLVGRKIIVATWRVDAHEIPVGTRDRMRWLDEQWMRMDDWIDSRQAMAEPAVGSGCPEHS